MTAVNGVNAFGGQLRRWRQSRRLSQLQLAVDAGISPRHLSFIETGRSQPSREMVLHLGDHLRLPLREQNVMLLAAGFAPAFEQRALNSPEMSSVRESVEMVLKSHEPFPAIAVDRKWNVVVSNCGAPLLAEGVSPELLGAAANVYRLSLHPKGFRPRVLNFAEYACHMVARLRHDLTVSGDLELAELLEEVESYPGMRTIVGASANRRCRTSTTHQEHLRRAVLHHHDRDVRHAVRRHRLGACNRVVLPRRPSDRSASSRTATGRRVVRRFYLAGK